MAARRAGKALIRSAGVREPLDSLRSCTTVARCSFSFIRNLFESVSSVDDKPLDKTPAAVSLFDKESLLHNFQSQLDALLSREDSGFDEYIRFLRNAEHPPAETPPDLKAHTTDKLVRLLDALTYISHFNHSDDIQRLIDNVSSVLIQRRFLLGSKSDIAILTQCAACLSRSRSPSQQVQKLILHVNSEFRKSGDEAIRSGQLVNILNSLAHITHPSIIDFIVHTCTRSITQLTPGDLEELPRLLNKYKVDNERVMLAVFQHVANSPSAAFKSQPNHLRRFLKNVASFAYLENDDGIVTDKAHRRFKELLSSRVAVYDNNELFFILAGIPDCEGLPPDSKETYATIIREILDRLGILSNDNLATNERIQEILRTLSHSHLLTLTDTVTRIDLFTDEIRKEADALADYLSGLSAKIEDNGAYRMTGMLQYLASELCSRADMFVSPPILKMTNEEPLCHVLSLSDMSVIISVCNVVMPEQAVGYDTPEKLLLIAESRLKGTRVASETELYNLLNHLQGTSPTIRNRLTKHALAILIGQSRGSRESIVATRHAMKLLRSMIVKESDVSQFVKHTGIDSTVINEICSYAVSETLKSTASGIIDSKTKCEALSEIYVCLLTVKNSGLGCASTDDLLSRVKLPLQKARNDSNGIFSRLTLRNIMSLPVNDEIRRGVEAAVTSWSESLCNNTRHECVTLYDAVTYLIELCHSLIGEKDMVSSLDHVTVISASVVKELTAFESFVETKLSTYADAGKGANPSSQNAWDASTGLRELFKAPREHKDIYVAIRNNDIKRYLPVKAYMGIQEPGNCTTMFDVKRSMQSLHMRLTRLELLLDRLNEAKNAAGESIIERMRVALSDVSSSVNRCVNTVSIFQPIWPDTYLPRKHNKNLVNAAFKRLEIGERAPHHDK
ncbi:uncharacterized protein BXIN_1759 [Babesia sp. Xinjiang]|nr:uncharacterized protein BXIN_1759 [Babesia sp. Xinjiang]ORM40843.1 hypothetical protein BXIN_1759 [Babesia sp. Xinjiang]